ncbi:MAG: transglutaminase domain-containing protein [Thermoanaerobaculia bacterium]
MILVTAAGGRTGGHVVRQRLTRDHPIRGFVHRGAEQAFQLTSLGLAGEIGETFVDADDIATVDDRTTVRSRVVRSFIGVALIVLLFPSPGWPGEGPADNYTIGGAPTATTPEMASWARRRVASKRRQLSRLRALHFSFVTEGPLHIEEIMDPSPSAAEAFATKRSDCMGFALLLVSLAREVGVEASYVLSLTINPGEIEGALRVRRTHLATTFGGSVFDLGGEEDFDPKRHELITDRTAVALFYSNRGVQELRDDRIPEAVELLWQALRSDPSLSVAWTNLGVALRHSGDSTGAVLAHQMALRLNPASRSALVNLSIASAEWNQK